MRTLQKLFDELLHEELTGRNLLYWFIRRRLRHRGIRLTEKQEEQMRKQLDQLSTDRFTISLSADQVRLIQGDEPVQQVVSLDWTDEDVDEFLADVSHTVVNFVGSAIQEASAEVYQGLRRSAPAMLRERRRDHQAYSEDVLNTWRRPLDLLESYIQLCIEAGSDFAAAIPEEGCIEQPLVVDVLTRLHARACRVANEILCLLSNGYPDGAQARWRSLHEISTVAAFIAKHGDELAERYTLHARIDSYRAALQYQKHCAALGYAPLQKHELNAMAAECKTLKRRFGQEYAHPYGWAAKVLGKTSPCFADVELAVGLDHYRPFYKMASYSVHADAKGMLFSLALFGWEGDVLLTGPSLSGLADPGQCTAISLGQITTQLLLAIKPNIDRLIVCSLLSKYTKAICDEFGAVHSRLSEPPE